MTSSTGCQQSEFSTRSRARRRRGAYPLGMVPTQSHWESFAREEPEWFILTDLDQQVRPGESRREAFFRTGREAAEEMLAELDGELTRRDLALEIGPGVGRLTLAMAPHFEEVRAVDASSVMLGALRENATERGHANLSTFLPHERWDAPPELDLVYSRLVFQHIEDAAAIEDYILRIGAALAPEGRALLQFDTRPRGLDYRLRNLLPDFALPRSQRRGIRRIRRDPAWLDALLKRAGLVAERENARGTATHTLLLRRG